MTNTLNHTQTPTDNQCSAHNAKHYMVLAIVRQEADAFYTNCSFQVVFKDHSK